MIMSILIYAAVNELTCKTTEMLLDRYYSPNNVLLYDIMEKCEFHPRINDTNSYDAKPFIEGSYREAKGYYSFPPVDEKLLKSMGQYEGEIYKMMNRFFPPLRTYDDRQRVYFSALRLCNGLIESNHIDCFVLYGLPHQFFDFVIYCLCKTKGIKTIITYRMPAPGYVYYFYDLKEHIDRRWIEQATGPDRSDDADNDYYLNYINNSHKGVRPYYMSSGTVRESLDLFEKRIRQFAKYKGMVRNLPVLIALKIKKNKRVRYIRSHSSTPDYGKKYLYFALHYQPEATTSPMSGVFANQQLCVQMLSYHVPDDVYIYVKEHPNQRLGGEKYRVFFEELSELRNVKLMPLDANSNELENNAIAIVTCTGTVAFEAMFKKKPSILFGNYIFNYMPGAFTVTSNEECKDAIDRVLEGVTITDESVMDYIRMIERMSYHAEWSIELKEVIKNQGLSLEENNNNLFKMICDAIES